jgi:hypothetical protein
MQRAPGVIETIFEPVDFLPELIPLLAIPIPVPVGPLMLAAQPLNLAALPIDLTLLPFVCPNHLSSTWMFLPFGLRSSLSPRRCRLDRSL